MVRKNPATVATAAPVADDQMADARQAAEQAAAHLAEVEQSDATADGWASQYEQASAAARITARLVEKLEAQRAAEVERARKRAAVAKTAAPEIKAMAADLAASRDKAAAAASAHLRALADFAAAADAHNALVNTARARLADLGLSAEHGAAEGTLGSGRFAGVRAAGTDWTVIPGDGFVHSACRQVFPVTRPGHPFGAYPHKFLWAPSQIAERPDGLPVPTLET